MWRVYQIFHSPKPNKSVSDFDRDYCNTFITLSVQLLKTWHLLCVVATFIGIGVTLLMIRTVAQALNDPDLVPDSENPEGRTVLLQCNSNIMQSKRMLSSGADVY